MENLSDIIMAIRMLSRTSSYVRGFEAGVFQYIETLPQALPGSHRLSIYIRRMLSRTSSCVRGFEQDVFQYIETLPQALLGSHRLSSHAHEDVRVNNWVCQNFATGFVSLSIGSIYTQDALAHVLVRERF